MKPDAAPRTAAGTAIDRPRMLVIKLGALGDVVQAAGPFAAIRREHADTHITLLTRCVTDDGQVIVGIR